MKMLKFTGNNTTQRVYLEGDKKNPEPEEVYIHFPGGSIGVCRCSDNSYWAHFNLEENRDDYSERQISEKIDARIDSRELYTNEMDIGDLSRDDCYHVAIKIKRRNTTIKMR